jgi:hypothetical protein
MGSRFKCSAAVIPFRCSFLGALQNFLRSRVFPKLDAALRASTPDMSIDHHCIVSSSFEKSLVRAGTHRIFPCRLLSMASSQHFHDFQRLVSLQRNRGRVIEYVVWPSRYDGFSLSSLTFNCAYQSYSIFNLKKKVGGLPLSRGYKCNPMKPFVPHRDERHQLERSGS